MDKDGNLLAVSGERRVRIWNNHDWMAEELDDDSGEPSAHGPYTRYSLQTVEEVPWKPESGDSIPIHEGAAPCISRMSDRSDAWNRTSGLP